MTTELESKAQPVCAWCIRDGLVPIPGGRVTHGICRAHAEEECRTFGLTLGHSADGVEMADPMKQEALV